MTSRPFERTGIATGSLATVQSESYFIAARTIPRIFPPKLPHVQSRCSQFLRCVLNVSCNSLQPWTSNLLLCELPSLRRRPALAATTLCSLLPRWSGWPRRSSASPSGRDCVLSLLQLPPLRGRRRLLGTCNIPSGHAPVPAIQPATDHGFTPPTTCLDRIPQEFGPPINRGATFKARRRTSFSELLDFVLLLRIAKEQTNIPL